MYDRMVMTKRADVPNNPAVRCDILWPQRPSVINISIGNNSMI